MSVKMWSSLAYSLVEVEQGSEALGSVGSQIGFIQVRMGAAICSLVYRYRTSTYSLSITVEDRGYEPANVLLSDKDCMYTL